MADFPPAGMVAKEDSKYRSERQKDPALRHEMDGGYVVTRARYTRPPRKTFTTGFTHISQADKVLLQNFFEARRGGANSFTWDDPVTLVTYTVRFVGEPEYKYVGMGTTYLWDVSNITLEQV